MKITDKQYYSEKRVSSSSLKWFEFSPKYFIKNINEEIKQVKLSFFELGKQIHMSILEPHLFEKYYTYLEYETPKSKNQLLFCEEYVKLKKSKITIKEARIQAYTKAYAISGKSEEKIDKESTDTYKSLKKYIEYLQKSTEYKEVLSKSKWELISDLKNAVTSHKKANELLINKEDLFDNNSIEYFNEHVIFWEYPDNEYKVKCKSMLDRFIIDHKNKTIKLVDVKTTSSIGDFKDHFEHFKYNRQLAFYWMAIYAEIAKKVPNFDDYKKETYIVALQTKDLPECKVFNISDNYLNEGLDEIHKLMSKISWHYQNDLWEYSKEYYESDGAENLN